MEIEVEEDSMDNYDITKEGRIIKIWYKGELLSTCEDGIPAMAFFDYINFPFDVKVTVKTAREIKNDTEKEG